MKTPTNTTVRKWLLLLERQFKGPAQPEDGLVYWREKILRVLLGTAVVIGVLVLVPTLLMLVRSGHWLMAVFELAVYFGMIGLMFAVSVPYAVRAGLMILTSYAIGVWVIISFGLLSGGPAWLFMFAVAAGILLGLRAAIAAIAVNAATLVLLWYLSDIGLIGAGQLFFPTPERAVVAGVNFLFLNALVTVSIAVLMKGLQSAVQEAQDASNELRAEIAVRRQAEKDLKKSETKYRLLAENIADAIWMMDMQLRLTYVSPVIHKMLGWPVEKFVQLRLDEILTPEAYETVIAIFTQKLKQSKDGIGLEQSVSLNLDHCHRDGGVVPMEVRACYILDPDKKNPVGILGVTRDISERLRAIKEKESLQEQLAHSKKMEALGLLAGGVAHDLNNVLSGIVSYPDLLLLDVPQDSSLRQPLESIRQSGRKAAGIVQDLLALTRRGARQMSVLDLNRIVAEYVVSPEHVEMLQRFPGSVVETNLAADLLAVQGSELHLKKVLMNLAINAAESQPEGGWIRIETDNCFVEPSCPLGENQVSGDCVRLKVRDNGQGIAEENLSQIFEPFFTRKVLGRSGTGLGLAVVWGTIQDHRGHIAVDSRIGAGTTFEIYLPATRRRPDAAAEADPAEQVARGDGETILVVDDLDDQLELSASILRRLNYLPVTASSGENALVYVRENEVDAVILDMIMTPGIDGLETYRRLKTVKPGLKVLIATGYAATDRVREALRLGAGAHVKKPYTTHEIGQALNRILGKDSTSSGR